MSPHTDILGRPVAQRSFADGAARLVRYSAGHRMPVHQHEWTGVTLVVAGQFIDTTEGGSSVCDALTLVLKPAGAEHATRVGPDGALTIHFELSRRCAGRLFEAGVPAAGCSYLIAGRATAQILGLFWPTRPGSCAPLAELLCDAILPRQVDSPPVDSESVAQFAEPSAWETSRDAAAIAGMHPVAYARRFRRETGWSPSAWRTHQRIVRAAAALAAGDESMVDVAFDAGFADQAHLCRWFKRETGLTPGRYRRIVRSLQQNVN